MNIFEERNDNLVAVDYGPILEAVRKAVKKTDNLFMVSPDTGRLRANVSQVASEVSDKTFERVLVGSERGAKAATVNFDDGRGSGDTGNFYDKVRAVREALRDSLLAAAEKEGLAPDDLVSGLLVPLEDLRSNRVEPGFGYTFPEHKGIKRRRLMLQEKGDPGSKALLSLHRLTVEVDASKFDQNLPKSLENHFERTFADLEEEDEDLYYEIEGLLKHTLETEAGREQSGLDKLRELLSEEALGIIKREASTFYLDFLLDGVPVGRKGRERLEHLRDRLGTLRRFVDDDRPDSDYTVSYGDAARVNLRELFSQTDAVAPLPVVPQVEGSLGEWRDDSEATGKMRYTYGMKLKLNGAVAWTGDVSSLAYHANVVDPDTELHNNKLNNGQARAIVRFAVLYAFFFDPEVEDAKSPVSPLASRLIEVLKGSDMTAKKDELRKVARVLKSRETTKGVDELVEVLKWLLKKESVLTSDPKTTHIGVARNILEDEAEAVEENKSFFKEEFRNSPKTLLKHVSVGNADSRDWFFSVPLRLELNNPRFGAAANASETHAMSYETEDMKALPVFLGLMPADKEELRIFSGRQKQVLNQYTEHVHKKRYPFVLFPYGIEASKTFANENSRQAFVYSLAFGLLAYLTLDTLLSFSSENVYMPILRFHTNEKDDAPSEESFFRSLSKTIAHLLSEYPSTADGGKRVSRSQGLVVGAGKPKDYKLRNASTSMYAGVPMRFEGVPGGSFGDEANDGQADRVDKFAIVAVSSWESDSAWPNRDGNTANGTNGDGPNGRQDKLSCAYGEAVTLDRDKEGAVLLRQFGTFASVYDERQLHQSPDVLQDVVDKLYDEGYRRIAFIAMSPFQSRLALTRDDERLFFLSKETLRFLRGGRDDLYIYPVFFDKYFVVKSGKEGLKANSLYIQDVGDLQRLAGRGRSTIPFLHVFNGISVGSDRFYNGTLAYSAVLGAYQGELDEQAIREDLIFDGREGRRNWIKDDLIRYLTLFHLSRFEKSGGDLGFSLTPFDNLFGGRDNSVGGGSVFPHAGGRPLFNSLAFLSKAKDALLEDRPRSRAG